jgi:hypothetical protein
MLASLKFANPPHEFQSCWETVGVLVLFDSPILRRLRYGREDNGRTAIGRLDECRKSGDALLSAWIILERHFTVVRSGSYDPRVRRLQGVRAGRRGKGVTLVKRAGQYQRSGGATATSKDEK